MQDLIGCRLGHYRIVEKIGAGGMGVVYLAHDERLDRDVAIKVLPEEVANNPDRLARFEREARALAALNHPNIATIHGLETVASGTDTDSGSSPTTFLVMELLEGQSLREMLAGGRLPVSKAVEYARAIASGLAAAHEKGIIHRDLKPENVFVARHGHAKILDFGLAKLIRPERDVMTAAPTATLETSPGAILGTAPYMAPEQLRGESCDERADIFALGVLLYEMLSGRRPFHGRSAVEIATAILGSDPPPIRSIAAEVPQGLANVVDRCLEKSPEDRFSSARDLGLALAATAPGLETKESDQKLPNGKTWVHGLAVAIAVIVALLVVLPPEGLWQRFMKTPERGPIRAIAVLPLENLSSDPDQEYFADGMTDALISKLAQVGSFDVISRTSVMAYKGSREPLPKIARELGVDAIVEGSVARGEDDVRITVQLIDGASDRHLWADDYQRPLRDVLVLQGEIARAVAHEIDAALTPEESRHLVEAREIDPAAHEAYLRGVHFFLLFTGDGLVKAGDYLKRAIEIDPEYASAHALLAAVELNSVYFLSLPPTEVVPRARLFVDRALELDPGNADAMVAKGWIEMVYDWDWDAAESSHLRALELAPSRSTVYINYAYLLGCTGRVDEAVNQARRAEQLDPLSPLAGQQVGMMLYVGRRYEEAAAQLERTIEFFPHYWFAHQRLAQVQMAAGNYDLGIDTMKTGIELAGPGTPRAGEHTLAALYALSGRREAAVRILHEIEDRRAKTYIPPCDLALINTALGNVDEAFRWLHEAVEVHDGDLFMTKVWPVWDPLREDPRFGALLQQLNLSEDRE